MFQFLVICSFGFYEGTSGARRSAAFFVGLSENMGPVVDNTDVLFDSVVTNVGSAYDRDTGKFAAPADGVYQFNVVISAQGRQKVWLFGYKLIPAKDNVVAENWAKN